jgi:hypothetical protein
VSKGEWVLWWVCGVGGVGVWDNRTATQELDNKGQQGRMAVMFGEMDGCWKNVMSPWFHPEGPPKRTARPREYRSALAPKQHPHR